MATASAASAGCGLKNGTSGIHDQASRLGGPYRAFYGPGHFLVAPKSVKESNGTLEGEADRLAEARTKVNALDNAAFEVSGRESLFEVCPNFVHSSFEMHVNSDTY